MPNWSTVNELPAPGPTCVSGEIREMSACYLQMLDLTGRDLNLPKKSDWLVEGRPSGVIVYNHRLFKSYRLRPEC